MNDIYVWLIILGLVYILPEILGQSKKRKGKGKYEYPQFPDSPHSPPQTKPQGRQSPKPAADYLGTGYEYYPYTAKTAQQEVLSFSRPETAPVAVNLPPPVNVPSATSDVSPWQNTLTPQVLANAVVFSEIISPPLARRPAGRRYGANRL